MRSLAVFFLIVVAVPSITYAEPKALNPPVEFAIVLAGSKSIYFEKGDNIYKLAEIVNKWPDYFVISEEASRVAVVQFGNYSRIELELTGDETKVRGLKMAFLLKESRTDTALNDVKDQVFKVARDSALKIVVIFTDGISTDIPLAKKAAEKLREDEVSTYVVFIGDKYKEPKVKEHIDNDLAGDPDRVFPIEDLEKLTGQFLEVVEQRLECDFDEMCLFNGTTCQNAWVRRVQNRTCSNGPPTSRPSKKTCNKEKCEEECDKWWKWNEDKCDDESNIGKTVPANRVEPKPHRLDQCSMEKIITCPTTTGGKTTSKTGGKTTSKTGGKTTSKTGGKTTSKTGGNTTDPRAVEPLNEGTSADDKKGLAEWIIALIVVGIIVCVLLAIIVVAVVIHRKKKRAKEAERAAATKKKADQEKAEKENAEKEKVEKEKAEKEKAAKINKPKLGASKTKPVNAAMSQRVGGADEKMLVSLYDDMTKKTSSGGGDRKKSKTSTAKKERD